MTDTPPIASYAGEIGIRVLPQNIDAEESVLGAVMLKNEALDEIDFLVSTDFYQERHRKVFAAMLSLWEDGTSIDLVTLGAQLRDAGDFDAAGGEERLMFYLGRVPHAESIVFYARVVAQKSMLRQAIEIADKLEASAFALDADPLEVLEQAAGAISDLQIGSTRGGSVTASTASDKARERYVEATSNTAEDGQAGIGFSWGITTLNNEIGKLVGGELISIAGDTGFGKTILAFQTARHVAEKTDKKQGYPVLYFMSEMKPEHMADRAAADYAEIDHKYIRSCDLSKVEAESYSEALTRHAGLNLEYVTQFFHSPQSMVSYAKAYVRRSKSESGLIVVDVVQRYAKKMARRREDVTFFCGQIATLFSEAFKDTGWPVIAVNQFTKEGKGSDSPTKANIYGDSAIIDDSDIVLILAPDPEDANRCIAKSDKSRSGARATTYLYKDFAHMRFQGQSPSVRAFNDDQEDMSFRNDADGYMPDRGF